MRNSPTCLALQSIADKDLGSISFLSCVAAAIVGGIKKVHTKE
jgi:hypothetical protein